MDCGFPSDVHAWLRAWCGAQRVELCYLYGSRARGQGRADSDYDLAVRFAAQPTNDVRDRSLGEFSEALARQLSVPESRVDVHDLDEMPLALQFRVLRDGVRLWESPEGAHNEFYVRVMGEYLDYRYYEGIHLVQMRQRVREGRFGA